MRRRLHHELLRHLVTVADLAATERPELAAAVDEFDASVSESNEARRDHVGAGAELKAVSDEVLRLVEMLDGLNRYRFGANAELRAAWQSARNVVGGAKAKEAVEAPPAEGDVRPAA